MDILILLQIFIKSGIIIGAILIGANMLFVGSFLRGMSSKVIGFGIILLALNSVDLVLEYIHLDLADMILPAMGEALFHDLLSFTGLFLISYGLFRLSKNVIQK